MPRVMLGRPASYDDLAKAPEHLVAEIVDGELWISPRPAPPHARAQTAIGSFLAGPFDHGRGGPGGWHILFEPELHLGSDILVPDIAGWRREHLPRLPEAAHISTMPDWICEVVSPTTALLDRARKLRVYARERVPFAWMVDPVARTLEILKLQDTDWTLAAVHGGSAVERAEPFEKIGIELALVWAED